MYNKSSMRGITSCQAPSMPVLSGINTGQEQQIREIDASLIRRKTKFVTRLRTSVW